MNVAITIVIHHNYYKKQDNWQAKSTIIVLFILPLAYNFYANFKKTNDNSINVALVQTNENNLQRQDSLELNKNLNHLLQLVDSVARSNPDLIVLPESAFKFPLMQSQENFDAIKSYILKWKSSLAVGFHDFPDTTQSQVCYNAAFVFTPSLAYYWDSLAIKTSELKVYHKQNPLPMAEMIPFSDFLGIKGKVLPLGGYETLSGNEPYVFSFPDKKNRAIKTSITICWEQLFPETQAALAANGAQFFTQMNNDGWFGNSSGAAQLLNMNRLRAIENRRAIARCSNAGISGFIDKNGKLYEVISTQQEGIKTAKIALNSEITFFSKYENWFPKFLLFVLIILFLGFKFSFRK